MTNEIKSLEKRVEELEQQLDDAKELLNKAKLEACPIKTGDIVIYKGVEHRVVSIDVSWKDLGKPWLVGNPKKSDGTFGTAKRNLYSHWEKP